MAKIERFEDIEAWKRARVLTTRVYRLTRDGPAAKDFAFRDQIRRAAMSVMLTFAEGYERESGDKDFRHFLSLAKGSVGEVRAALYIGIDSGYFTQTEFDELAALALEAARMLSRFISYLRTSLEKT